MPKNRGSAWAAAMRKIHAPTTIMIFFQNLLPNCKVLNINTPKKQKVPKETNWKQKFQKPQNENICLTYLNMEMNGNFHFLSFCAAFLKVQNQVL